MFFVDLARTTTCVVEVPLTPAYAMTAHSSQGKTLEAVLLDLNVEKRVDTTFGAVAASRVRSRHDALILRPFPLWLFQRGAVEGPQLLLKTLRGEEIDWAAYREGRKPSATCSQCQQVREIDGFEFEQWDKIRANLPGICMGCKHGKSGPRAQAGKWHHEVCLPQMQGQQDRGRLSTSTTQDNGRRSEADLLSMLQSPRPIEVQPVREGEASGRL